MLIRPGPRISQHGRVVSQRQMPPAEATRTASGFSNAHISLEICLASFFALKIMRCFLPQEWTQVGYGTRCIVQTTPRTTPAKSPLEMKVSKIVFIVDKGAEHFKFCFDQNTSVQPVCEDGWTMAENLCFRFKQKICEI